MDYKRKAYFRETEDGDDDVKATLVIGWSEDAGYRVTENRSGKWCKPFWMPESELLSRDTEYVGQLKADKFEAVEWKCQQ